MPCTPVWTTKDDVLRLLISSENGSSNDIICGHKITPSWPPRGNLVAATNQTHTTPFGRVEHNGQAKPHQSASTQKQTLEPHTYLGVHRDRSHITERSRLGTHRPSLRYFDPLLFTHTTRSSQADPIPRAPRAGRARIPQFHIATRARACRARREM